jgi:lipopolysaccharide export system permease protein
LTKTQRTVFNTAGKDSATITRQSLESFDWPTEITPRWCPPRCSSPTACAPSTCSSTSATWTPTASRLQRYEIEFWRKVFYPLSCIVMVVLALPFAYLHFRAGGIATYVFGGCWPASASSC